MLVQLGLEHRISAWPEQLSGGQRQRVAIARALCMEPRVLLYDEPTSALDPSLKAEVLRTLKRVDATGVTQVVVTHDLQLAKGMEHVCVLDHGKVIESGPPAQVLGAPAHASTRDARALAVAQARALLQRTCGAALLTRTASRAREPAAAVLEVSTDREVASSSHHGYPWAMMRTTKISIAIDKVQLRLARKAAKSEGLSLSAYIGRALGNGLEDQRRLDAARELHESWGPESIATAAEREEFLARMSRPRKRRSKAA